MRCGDAYAGVQARTFWFHAGDGTLLDGAELGAGPEGVVLAHEIPSDLCGWVAYGRRLADAGFHVVLVDLRGSGLSHSAARDRDQGRVPLDVASAAGELRRRGAKRVVLMGASAGGVASVVAAASLRPPAAGLIDLSGERELGRYRLHGQPLSALAAAPHVHVPTLYVVARQDRYISVADARRVLRRLGSQERRLVVEPGPYHGWDLLQTAPYHARVDALVLAFLHRHLDAA